MNNSEALEFLQHFHDRRKRNNPDDIIGLFTEDAVFSIAGQERKESIAVRDCEPGTLPDIARILVAEWEWIDVDFKTVIAEGDLVIARYDLTVRHVPTNRTTVTDIVDFMTVRDGKVASMRQFVDTAHLSAIALGDG